MGLRYGGNTIMQGAGVTGGFNPLQWGLGMGASEIYGTISLKKFQYPSMGLRYWGPPHSRPWFPALTFQSPSMGLRYGGFCSSPFWRVAALFQSPSMGLRYGGASYLVHLPLN